MDERLSFNSGDKFLVILRGVGGEAFVEARTYTKLDARYDSRAMTSWWSQRLTRTLILGDFIVLVPKSRSCELGLRTRTGIGGGGGKTDV